MEKIAISVIFNKEEFTSNWCEKNDTEFNGMSKLCEEAAKGELAYLKFNSGSNEYFFPENVIKQSVIILKTKE